MYKVTKAFIYRAQLYPINTEIPESEYVRMMRDKVAIRRGIPDMIVKEKDSTAKKPASKSRGKK